MVGSAADNPQARRLRRLVILPAAVVVLLGVVALASRAPLRPLRATPLGTAVGHGGSVSPWTLALFGVGAAAMLGTLAVNVFATRRRAIDQRVHLPMLFLICVAWSLLLLVAILVAHRLAGGQHATRSSGLGRGTAPIVKGHATAVQFPLWAQLIVALVVFAAGMVMLSTIGRRWRATDPPTVPTLAPKMTDAIDRSLDDLQADPDPRRAIIAAYRRMEESLASVGLRRAGSETAREYLSRGLALLELSPSTIGTLTTLFERAKFSLRHVDLGLRDEAIAALRALQEELSGT